MHKQKLFITFLLVGCACIAAARADDIASLRKEYNDEQTSFQKQMEGNVPESKFNELYNAHTKHLDGIASKALSFEETHKGKDGFDALALAMAIAEQDPPVASKVMSRMDPYMGSEEFTQWSTKPGLDGLGIVRFLQVDLTAKDAFLRKVMAANPTAKPLAQFFLGTQYCENIGSLQYRKASQDKLDESRKTAIDLLSPLRNDPTPMSSGNKRQTVGDGAQKYLFELEHLQVGMEAPDIIGSDESGKEFKLSDYRGKVVLLDFWGFW